MTTAIQVEGIGKRYELGVAVNRHRTLRDAFDESLGGLRRTAGRLAGRGAAPAADRAFWALRDVSFTIAQGDAVGLVGGNGAGKSTLLKLLTRITAPTQGRALIRGRVGSLLEVGTGFHPDLSGRENVFLNGAILGMRRSEVARKFDEIVAFSEVERFIDTPVKRYSSGMYLRLAFAVAAHLEPEVLLVDEVLAVGDAAFQKKCLGKMGDVTAQGRTVVFVSHNLAAVQTLCRRALWLRDGRLAEDGPSGQVVSRYLQATQADRPARAEQVWPDPATAPGNEKVRLHRAAVRRDEGDGDGAEGITTRTPFRLEFEYWNLDPGARLSLSAHVYDERGVCVFNVVPATEREWRGRAYPVGRFRDVCHIPGDLMNDGTYHVELFVVHDDATIVHHHRDLLTFEVLDTVGMRGGFYGRWAGAVRPIVPWTTELVEVAPPAAGPTPRERA